MGQKFLLLDRVPSTPRLLRAACTPGNLGREMPTTLVASFTTHCIRTALRESLRGPPNGLPPPNETPEGTYQSNADRHVVNVRFHRPPSPGRGLALRESCSQFDSPRYCWLFSLLSALRPRTALPL